MSEQLTPRQELAEQLHIPVALDIGYLDIDHAIKCYQEVLELPAKYQEASRFKLDTRGNTQFGQFERVPGDDKQEERGVAQDSKDIFHFGSLTRQVMESRLDDIPVALSDFLSIAEDIFWANYRGMRRAMSDIDDYRMGLVGLFTDERAALNQHLRFITYYENDGEYLAAGHYDRSVGTIAVAESHRGLRIGSGSESLSLLDRGPDESIFFLGAGWEKLPPDIRTGSVPLRPAYHDVLQLPEQGIDDKLMRWAVVCFFNPFELDTVPAPQETRPEMYASTAA